MRDAKLVLRASLERMALGKARVESIAVMLWTWFRAAVFTSSKFMMQQFCGRSVLKTEVCCHGISGNGV